MNAGMIGAAARWLMTIVGGLLAALSVIALYFTSVLIGAARKRGELAPKPEAIGLGAVTNFFDTLGIGSFAPTTAYMKLRRMAPDSYFPAILNAGHALPTVTQALVFITLVQVDPMLLLACIIASCLGAFVGAPIVQKSPVRLVQGVVGLALLIGAVLFALKNLNLLPPGGADLTLPPALFAIAVGAELGLTREEIQRGLAACKPAKMRMEFWEAKGVGIINDAYNANADSMIAALSSRTLSGIGDRGFV